MADVTKVSILREWVEELQGDELTALNEKEMAYVLYGLVTYGLTGEKTDMSIFGSEYKSLNRSISGYYGQIDRVMSFGEKMNSGRVKYDNEKIKELRLKGHTAKQICIELDYGEDKAKSITTTRGWTEAGQILKQMKTENTDSVQNVQKKTDSVQVGTDSGSVSLDDNKYIF